MDTPKSTGHMTEALKVPPDIERVEMEDVAEIGEYSMSEEMGRKCKLSIFPSKHFFNQASTGAINHDLINEEPELVLHHDDFPYLKIGDVVEIYQPDVDPVADDSFPRLLLTIGPSSLFPNSKITKPIHKDTVYVEKTICDGFHLQNFQDTIVKKVDPKSVALDSVELTFKEQYMGRSEMWRIKKKLVNSCAFLNKKVELCGGSIRCYINEMWASDSELCMKETESRANLEENGSVFRVACGVITSDTQIVFRSTSAMVYLFIQMSSEMWDHDSYGDLYFEKAVGGMLKELFQRWSKTGSAHEVTIVLFTRCFYEAKTLEEFPKSMQECLQRSTVYGDCYYEDFYHVAVQNERFEDWMPTVLILEEHFSTFRDSVLNYHHEKLSSRDESQEGENIPIPKARISSASQGNFLEVLNMSLNTFENHYLNRNLDRTGQQSIVITPGVGIFEVDRELMLITKQRIIDSGVGSDLICVGEQPLHAVPLFRFYDPSKESNVSQTNQFSMPHWINMSFYHPNKRVGYSAFNARIKIPSEVDAVVHNIENNTANNCRYGCCRVTSSTFRPNFNVVLHLDDINRRVENLLPEERDDDLDADGNTWSELDAINECMREHDKEILKLPSSTAAISNSVSTPTIIDQTNNTLPRGNKLGQKKLQRKLSDPEMRTTGASQVELSMWDTSVPVHKYDGSTTVAYPANLRRDSEDSTSGSNVHLATSLNVTSSFLQHAPSHESLNRSVDKDVQYEASVGGTKTRKHGSQSKWKIEDNTFDHQTIKRHFLQPGYSLINPFDPTQTTKKVTSNRRRWTHIFPKGGLDAQSYGKMQHIDERGLDLHEHKPEHGSVLSSSMLQTIAGGDTWSAVYDVHSSIHSEGRIRRDSDRLSNIWTTTAKCGNSIPWYGEGCPTGVDWKSLTIPATLPITTDYLPDERSLACDYLVNEYELRPENIMVDATNQRSPIGKSKLTNEEAFMELISQRLAQGFQLIIPPNKEDKKADPALDNKTSNMHTDIRHSLNSPQTPGKKTSILPMRKITHPWAEYWLSIGRIFQRVTLSYDQQIIKVKKYSPRNPYRSLKIHYRYRFKAPDNDNFDLSWVDFAFLKLENFNWNHMDYYVLTQGDKEYLLTDNLKYWRVRMYVVPLSFYVPYTRQIADGSSQFCDIYPASSEMQYDADLTEGFLRFVETCLNRCQRQLAAFRPTLPVHRSKVANRAAFRNRALTSVAQTSASTMDRGRTSSSSGIQSQSLLQKLRRESGGGPASIASQGSPGILDLANSASNVSGTSGSTGSFDIQTQATGSGYSDDPASVLNIETSTLAEILESMKIPPSPQPQGASGQRSSGTGGLNFFSKVPGLPPFTFVAYEAIVWLTERVNGVDNHGKAVELMEAMLDKRLIIHASGDMDHPFVNGFFFFTIVQDITQFPSPYNGDAETFRNDWTEIKFKYRNNDYYNIIKSKILDIDAENKNNTAPNEDLSNLKAVPEFLSDLSHFNNREKKRRMRRTEKKSASFDMDCSGARHSDRKEWWHLRYQQEYEPDSSFDIALQWSVATGALIADMIVSWIRKAQQNGLSLMPVADDPFALPIRPNSDPVRGPIFIQMDTSCLKPPKKDQRENSWDSSTNLEEESMFAEFDKATWENRTFLFREEIAKRFGFVATNIGTNASKQQYTSSTTNLFSTDHQYIHCTGNMFLLIPTQLHSQVGLQGIRSRSKPSRSGIELTVSREQRIQNNITLQSPAKLPTAKSNAFESVEEASENNANLENKTKEEQNKKAICPLKRKDTEKFSRHMDSNKPTYDHSETGFLWSWNCTLSKRWKQSSNTGATGDIPFMDKVLADFRNFCANKDNRLKDFWDDCWAKKQASDDAIDIINVSN